MVVGNKSVVEIRDLIVEGLLEGILKYQQSLGNEPVIALASPTVF